MSSGIIGGNAYSIHVLTAAIAPASVATITTAEQTFTLTGAKVGDIAFVNKPSLTAGIGIANVRVSATDTIAITYVNPTAGPVTPATESITVLLVRPERATAATSISF